MQVAPRTAGPRLSSRETFSLLSTLILQRQVRAILVSLRPLAEFPVCSPVRINVVVVEPIAFGLLLFKPLLTDRFFDQLTILLFDLRTDFFFALLLVLLLVVRVPARSAIKISIARVDPSSTNILALFARLRHSLG